MDAIKPVLYSPVQKDGKRYLIHWQTEAGQVLMKGLKAFSAIGLSESDTALSAIEKLALAVQNSEGGIGTAVIGRALCYGELAIPAEGWESDETYGYHKDIENTEVTKEMVPYVKVVPESEETARACGMRASCQTFDGFLRVYAREAPARPIVASAAFIGGLKGGDAYGDLPLATAEQPGLVRIGAGLSVADGTVSVNTVDEDKARQTISGILND